MIIGDEQKYEFLKYKREIDLNDIEQIILNKNYLDILKNPKKENQTIFVVNYKSYIHIVPFILDKDKNIVIKTVYPSRKYNKLYGSK
ncbi:MAG: toxin [Candidatus Anammoxibacter sp.]